MSRRTFCEWGFVLLVGVATCYVIYSSFVRPSLRAPAIRASLVAFADGIDLGLAEARFVEMATVACQSEFRMHETDEGNLHVYAFETPAEVGAANWILYVASEDGAVKGVGFRKADGRHFRPSEAPRDRVAADIQHEWRTLFGGRKRESETAK